MSQVKLKRYSQALKQQVVGEYEAGASAYELQQKYGITGKGTIKRWVGQYGTAAFRSELIHIQSQEDQLAVQALRGRIRELEAALTASVLESHMLRSTLEVASATLQLDLKKKFGKP